MNKGGEMNNYQLELYKELTKINNKINELELEKNYLRSINPWYPIAKISGKLNGARAKRKRIRVNLSSAYLNI